MLASLKLFKILNPKYFALPIETTDKKNNKSSIQCSVGTTLQIEPFHHLKVRFQNCSYYPTYFQILALLLLLLGFQFCHSAKPYYIIAHQSIHIYVTISAHNRLIRGNWSVGFFHHPSTLFNKSQVHFHESSCYCSRHRESYFH